MKALGGLTRDKLNIFGGMHTLQLFVRGGLGRQTGEVTRKAGAFQTIEDDGDAVRLLRMVTTCEVQV
jgi:hypothetical protein